MTSALHLIRSSAVVLLLGVAGHAQTPLTTVRICAGLNRPVDLQFAPGDDARLFVCEQYAMIRIVDVATGQILSPPFLDFTGKLRLDSDEQGLLGLAFHPDYNTNGYFYVNYTRALDGATMIERYQVSSDMNVADPSSATEILVVPLGSDRHCGGCLVFDPKTGYLFIGTGDSGGGCVSQEGDALLGKMLRIDVDGGFPYAIPPDNPYVSDPAVLDEIWDFGMRNPWQFSFDRETGELYIGDVGYLGQEEVDIEPATSTGAVNYGWPVHEGINCAFPQFCNGIAPGCGDPLYTMPNYSYDRLERASVICGYVYRGCAIPDLKGTFFFADFMRSTLHSFRYANGTITDLTDRTIELAPAGGLDIKFPPTWGEDGCGELYIADLGSEVYKLVPNVAPPSVDLGYGKAGSGGKIPKLSLCGLLDAGNYANLDLVDAYPGSLAVMIVSNQNNPTSGFGGIVVPIPPLFLLPLFTDPSGEIHLVVPGGFGPIDIYIQDLIIDPGATNQTSISNALQLIFP